MFFPLAHKTWSISEDRESWRKLDLAKETEIPIGNLPGAFGFVRKNHRHEGVDIYGLPGDTVIAIRGGRIRKIGWFTGPLANSPWWNNTQAVLVEDIDGLWNYGEINVNPERKEGEWISAGDIIGTLETVLLEDKGRPMTMLHLERYQQDTVTWIDSWGLNQKQPHHLMDAGISLIKGLEK